MLLRETVSRHQASRVIEVWADVTCPFTHVGLRKFAAVRDASSRRDVRLWVRSWPLELVNGKPFDPAFIGEEVAELRHDLAPELFRGFTEAAFPATSLPGLALAAQAYEHGFHMGEAVSLELRDLLFERGEDIGRADVLDGVAARCGIERTTDGGRVEAEYAEGRRRGVLGSPHFFTPAGDFFCPALDISRDDGGHLHVRADPEGYDRFLAASFG